MGNANRAASLLCYAPHANRETTLRTFAFPKIAASAGLALLLGCSDAAKPSSDVAGSGDEKPVAAGASEGLM